jgi:hypothetical protein
MVSKTEQLRQALLEAEAQETLDQNNLKYHQDKYAGKCFRGFSQIDKRHGFGLHFKHIKRLENQHSTSGGDCQLIAFSRTISIFKERYGNRYEISRSATDDKYGEPFGIGCLVNTTEIPLSQFENLWKYVATHVKAMATHLATTMDPGQLDRVEDEDIDFGYSREASAESPLDDVPHLVLPSWATTILPEDYFLNGFRYVLSPTTISKGLDAVGREDRRLSRVLPLAMDCDMQYIRDKNYQLSTLREKLLDAKKLLECGKASA